MEEVRPKMRNVLKELGFQPQPNMIEENQVLMQLPHVANVRHHGKIEDPGQQTDGKEFADPRDPGAIDLDKRQRMGLEEVLEQDTVCDVLSGSDIDGAHRTGYFHVSLDVVRVGRLFDPVRAELRQFSTDTKSIRKVPA